ncbi:MAG: winged helix-turn-helix transcriptional regulator [Clostridiaceae bacterium]|nr:winged helix-turn-helix transcriptional regulator [Clostridiaceae bacterium]
MNYKDIVIRFGKLHILRRIVHQKLTMDYPLHPGQLHLLEFISKNEGCTQAQAAKHLMITPASVALSTKRMEKSQLIEKKTDPNNLRCNKLYITEKGKKLSETLRKTFDEFDRGMFKGFEESELITLTNYLDRLIDNITDKYVLDAKNADLLSMVALRKKIETERKKESLND